MSGFPGGSTSRSTLFLVNRSSIRLHIFYSPYVPHRSPECYVTSVYPQTIFATSAAVLVASYAP